MLEESKDTDMLSEKVKLSGIVSYLNDRWWEAKNAKIYVEQKMLSNMRAVEKEYDPKKLQAIREFGGSEAYIGITETKVRDASAWVKEILFQPSEPMWDIKPTPLPELPPEIEEEIISEVRNEYIQHAFESAAAGGQEVDINEIEQMIQEDAPEIKEMIQDEITKKATENTEKLRKKIDDQLTEGGFYKAVNEAIYDLIVLKAMIIKRSYKRTTRIIRAIDTNKGGFTNIIKSEIIPVYERRSPYDIYPAPDSNGIDDGYLFDKISLTPMQLQELIGLDGFDEKEINAVLEEYRDGGLHEWTAIDTYRTSLEEKAPQAITDSTKIDCLEFHGYIQGFYLKDCGITVKDENKWYSVVIWKIANHIIKAMLNPDDLGKKPYAKASFVETPGAFWGRGLPEIINDLQDGANVSARHLLNNIAIASAPLTEFNKDKMEDGESPTLYPWKTYISTDKQMNEAPALRVYNIPMHSEELINSINFWILRADEQSGIPAYAHGSTRIGGGGNTSSGLSMLMNAAARGVRNVVRNIDNGIIIPTIQKQFYDDMKFGIDMESIPDITIVAKGSSAALQKEQLALRLNEFMVATANPVDTQIVPPQGRAYAIKEYAKALNLNADKILPNQKDLPQKVEPQPTETDLANLAKTNPAAFQSLTGGSAVKNTPLDNAGNKVNNVDNRQFGREGR